MIRPHRPRRRRAAPGAADAIAPFLLVSCLALAPPSASAPATPVATNKPALTFSVVPESVRADERGFWHFSLRVENHTEWGLYPDSLFVDWVSEPPLTEGPSAGTFDLTRLARSMQPASAGEGTSCDINMPADIARGRILVRVQLHDVRGGVHVARKELPVVGSALAERSRSIRVEAEGRATELVMIPTDTAGPAAVILLVPSAGTAARSLLRWAYAQAEAGYSAAVLGTIGTGGAGSPAGASAPGSIEADPSGPASVALVREATRRLAREKGFAGGRTVLWGEQSGATAALLAAAGQAGLDGVIAVDATYDPWAAYRAARDSARSAFVRAAGRDSAAWRARAPLLVAEKIPSNVLVIRTDAAGTGADAQDFVARRAARSLPTEARIQDANGRAYRRHDVVRLARDFLARQLRGTTR